MVISEANAGTIASQKFKTYGMFEECNEKVPATEASIQEAPPDPDSLKNTPSNIARLEDVIEHCEARSKYLARTKSPSDGEDVRWYFCKAPLAENELSASVPTTAIIGKSDYFRFSVRDSLALEASFLQREEELLTYWWHEYAECSDGPGGPSRGSDLGGDQQPKSRGLEANESSELHVLEEERVGVPVKGLLYEVDLVKRHCFPVYWNGENRRVLRGHWFARKSSLDWLPIREDISEQLELAYRCQVWRRRTFQPSGLFAARIDLQGSTQGLHALFTGEDDTWEAWLAIDNSGFFVGLRGDVVKLRRGFSMSGSAKPTQDELRQQKEEEMDDYCSQVPVRHLVFMVHGIGQRLEKANLVDDVGDYRQLTASLAERHLTSYQRNTQRVLFIPCQWRRGLKLGGESAVEKCTLDGVRGLRVMLSATVHDVLYYMSPIYCQDIIDSVSNQLNRLYLKFIKRNPGYDGKVSIYGHSLGSVLSYDILCHQESLSSPFPMESMYKKLWKGNEPQTDEVNQFAESTLPTHLGSKTASINGGASMESNPIPCSQPTVFEEEQANNSFQIATDSHQLIDIPPEDDRCHSVGHSSPHSLQGCLSSDLGTNVECQNPDGGENVVDDGMSKDDENKNKQISLLRDEVNFLKEKIAKLESISSSSVSIRGKPEQSLRTEYLQNQDKPKKGYTPYIKYTKLEFKVDTFFAVGSPLGVFLALRNIRIGIGRGQEYWKDEKIKEEMPACCRMFNIFHPFDPVAYRLEPLVSEEYISKRPVIIPYHKGGKRLHIGFQDFTEHLAARSEAVISRFNSLKVKMMDSLLKNKDQMQEAKEEVPVEEERSYGSLMMETLTTSLEGRIDHVLQDKTFEHPYLQAIGAHTNYWRDPDTALFILKHLYGDIDEEPDTLDAFGLNDADKPLGLVYERDAMDEELPLTFSDNTSRRSFSRKVRWFMKRTGSN
ncbi:phospholipase SGR2 [Aristolochia californica]|uniref:phospholipase SGR2 n=1 Tax=Aristolochia californica TaxID=171875 RepID=UPI0035E21043